MDYPKSVLVTGVTGFIGSTVARRLIAAGVRTTGLMIHGRQQQRLANVADLRMLACADYSQASLEDALQEVRPDAIIHLAAAGVCGAVDVGQMLSVNIEFTANLVQAAARVGRPTIVHVGSCFEYLATQQRNLTETDTIQPFSVYGATKAASVHLALALARQLDLPLVVLRLFGVFGPGEADHRLVPTLIRNLAAHLPVPLTAGIQVRDWLHVNDAADAIISAAQLQYAQGDAMTYNVCTGVGTSVREVGELIANAMDRPRDLLQWGKLPARSHEPQRIVGDPTRFQAITSWSPQYDLASGLRQTIDTYRNATRHHKVAA